MAERESDSYSSCEEIVLYSLSSSSSFFLSTLIASALSANHRARFASDFDYREALIGLNETAGAIKVKMETKS